MPSPLGLLTSTSTSSPSLGTYQVISGKAVRSIFGNGQFSPFPNKFEGGNAAGIHTAQEMQSDGIYDTTIESIVDYTSNYPGMVLKYSDFAYLRDVGVYPNNRLVVARRFTSPIGNDLTSAKSSPMATFVSWFKDESPLSISFGENWEDADASFTEILNNIGTDLTSADSDNRGGTLGDFLSGGMGVVPLPGFTEGLQYMVLKRMGLTDNTGVGNHPLGNPNLIRKAQQRTTVSKDAPGSGLDCSISVKMEMVYEQKFISGLDPTLVYLDLIQNALTFGTSDAIFQFNGNFSDSAKEFVQNIISGDAGKILKAIGQFITALISAIGDVLSELISFENRKISDQKANQKAQEDAQKNGSTIPEKEPTNIAQEFANKIQKVLQTTVGTVVSKYKIKILGVVNALTGSPSGPWHVTIGNPKRPIFCSGDMIISEQVNIEFGSVLAFNDLPSTMKITVGFKNARPLGAQEIFDRMNTGRGRSYVRVQTSFVESNESLNVQELVRDSRAQDLKRINDDLNKQISDDERNRLLRRKQEIEQAQKDSESVPPSETAPPDKTKTPNVQDVYKVDINSAGTDYLVSNIVPPTSDLPTDNLVLDIPQESPVPNPSSFQDYLNQLNQTNPLPNPTEIPFAPSSGTTA